MVIEKESQVIKERRYLARKRSIKEGIFASAKSSFGDSFVSPFAIAINLSSSLVALLSSISGLLGPLTQTFSSRLIEKYSRKKIMLKAVLLEALAWIPFIIIAILFYRGILVKTLPFFLLFSFTIYIILANISSPAWFSWLGDLINPNYRGRWISKRNLIMGFVLVVLTISASFFLDYFKENNLTMFGFATLFFLAMIFRILSWRSFKRIYEPEIKLEEGYYFSFWNFVMNISKNNFGRFSILRTFLGFGNAIYASLLAVYLLRYLQLDYKIYMLVIFSGTVFSLGVMELWGKISDMFGNYKVLKMTCILIPIIPILWIVHSSIIYLALVPSIIKGIAWAGFNLAEGNFIYDNVSQEKRGLAVSYHKMLSGIGIFLGAGSGAFLIKFLSIKQIEPLFIIFIISCLVNIIVISLLLPKIKEVRKKRKYKTGTLHIIFRQIRPTLSEEVHQIMSIKKYLTK